MADQGAVWPDWTERMRGVVNDTIERSSKSTANFQRLLASMAAAGINPEFLTDELTRQGQQHGLDAYQRFAELLTRFTSGALAIVIGYRDEYLSELIPTDLLSSVGPPPAVPSPPNHSDPAGWAGWYQSCAAWFTQQQAWSSRVTQLLVNEVSSAKLRPEAIQTSANAFLQRRLPHYLADMAELNADLVSDVLGIADTSIDAVAGSILGDQGRDEMTVEVQGVAGTTVRAGLIAENSRSESALISCSAVADDGFGLTTAPREFQLGPGESRRVAIRVALAAEATRGRVEAGTVTIHGQGDNDLRVRVMALVEAPPNSPREAEVSTPPDRTE
jgi:hypothetical protein